MALVSMTGYGRGAADRPGLRVECEINTVNRKQFDVRLSVPRSLLPMEGRIQKRIHQCVARGHVTAVLRYVATGNGRSRVAIDEPLAAEVVRKMRRVGRDLKVAAELSLGELMRVPGVLTTAAEGDVAISWEQARTALDAALAGLVAMRRREGQSLEKDLVRRVKGLRRHHAAIAKRLPRMRRGYREALLARLADSGVAVPASDPLLLKELAVYAERADVTEELVRLDSHFDQADVLLTSDKPVGRTLEFLCQEMFREINTIGSKACDVVVARHVVEFKALLETVREQLQNVE